MAHAKKPLSSESLYVSGRIQLIANKYNYIDGAKYMERLRQRRTKRNVRGF